MSTNPEVITATAVDAPAAPKQAHASRHGFSLASLFVLTTATAALASGFAPVGKLLVSGEVGFKDLLLALVVGTLAGSLLGMILGMHRYERGKGALIGGAVGAGLGLFAAPLALVPRDALPAVGMAMFTGSVLMVAVALVMRPSKRAT
jgi:hypothetical protein